MYNFEDTTIQQGVTTYLPSEAVKVNGSYIENQITGYRTLYTTGRESLEKQEEVIDVTTMDGTIRRRSKFPARTITVGFELQATSAQVMAERFNMLKKILNVEDAEFIFADETDKFFIGDGIMDSEIEPRTFAKGEWHIICHDPFKYSTTVTTATISTYSENVTDEDGNTTSVTSNVFNVVNDGGYRTYPTFCAQFATDENASGDAGSNADCGYVLFAKGGTDYSVQLGDDKETDNITATTVLNRNFAKSKTGFTDSNSISPLSSDYTYSGSTKVETSASKGQGLKASSYGTSTSGKFYGPLTVYDIGSNLTGKFKLSWKQAMSCSGKTATGKKQRGCFWAFLLNSDNEIVYGFGIDKKKSSTLSADMYTYTPDNGISREGSVSLKYTGKFGHKSSSDNTGRLATISIKRTQDEDDNWMVEMDNPIFDVIYFGDDTTPPAVRKIAFYFGKFGSNALYSNRVTNAKFINGNFDDINTFGSGDYVEANCGTATITMGDIRNDLGDYDNDWEDMYLDVGQNIVYTQYSDWVTAGYEPTLTMKYRRRWL